MPPNEKATCASGKALCVELGKNPAMDSGEIRIRQLGYKQELRRNFTLVSNASIGFTAISILTGITGSFGIGWNNGGPVSILWGWVICSAMSLCVAACMAEITSSLPISGGPYYWSVELAKDTYLSSAFAGWITGWLNLLGQVALTASVDSSLANHISAMWVIYNGHVFSQEELLLCYAVCLVLHGFINMMSAHGIARFMAFSGAYQLVAAVAVIVLIPIIAPQHQSPEFVFRSFEDTTQTTGAPSTPYLFIVGMLLSQYTLTGYDACGHVSEETKSADWTSAWGMLMAVFMSVVLGLGYVISLLFSIQDRDSLTTGAVNGYVAGQIYYDAIMARFASTNVVIGIMTLPALAMFFCGASCVTSNSRMLWSFSRDGGIPFHRLWSAINRTSGTPILAVWAMVTFAFLLGLPMLHSTAAFQAVTSISTIGLYISYGIPILMRLINGKRFEPGPFNLGRYGPVIGSVAVMWVIFITAAFVLPQTFPVTVNTLNYAGVAVGIVMLAALLFWFLPFGLGARRWFRGEIKTAKIPFDSEGLGGTPKIAEVSLRDMHHVTRASNSQSSLSSMGSRMLASTKLTLLDLIHQYKASRASSSDAAAVQQRRKVTFPIRPLRVQDSSSERAKGTFQEDKEAGATLYAGKQPSLEKQSSPEPNFGIARVPNMPSPGSRLPPLAPQSSGRPRQAPEDFLHLFGKQGGKPSASS
ncbi:hypothetical protein CVIRNUC_006924 [Coccomyxa viridis]|uniref:Amino acid transporter n=1 Tax=Coccomyxa viridis TaxID=1274662 RepID=A0AAV1ICH7_9CHLO|nr:hypothetical protein CVIRNUC_006924 [Coccomyxa viridis]